MHTLELRSRWTRAAILVVSTLAASQLTRAACTFGTEFGQLLPNCGDNYCYVVSPGQHTAQSLAGAFWTFGSGVPAVGPGNDSGTLPVGDWLHTDGSSVYLQGDWQHPGVDGCITGHVAPGKSAEIMVALISDQGFYTYYFAAAAVRRVVGAYPEYDFTFAAGGGQGADIELVEIPPARIAGFTRPNIYELRAPTLAQVSLGLHSDGSVLDGELVTGYRVYTRRDDVSGHRPSDGWTAVTGTVPLGQNASVTVPGIELPFFAYTLVFDGDFETAYVGRAARPSAYCFPTDRDGDGYSDLYGDPECCPLTATCDCNDLNPNVNPGALEICNLIDDDCDGTIDNAALPGSVASVQLGKVPGATRLTWASLAVATGYDVVRGDLTMLHLSGGSFSAATKICLANDVAMSQLDDSDDPDPDYGFWYLARAGNCTGVGSYNATDASQVAPRDAGIAASGHACP